MDSTSLLILSSLCFCLVAALWLARKMNNRLPPGPFRIPIVGSIFKLGARPHQSLAKLAKIHGPLMTVKLGTVTTVVASSPAMAQQILQKHDQALAARAAPDAMSATHYSEFSVTWQSPATSQWRNIRKIFKTEWFTTEKLASNQRLQCQKVEQLVAHVEECSKAKRAVDIGQLASSTILNSISNTVFSKDMTSLVAGYGQDFKKIVWGMMEEGEKPNIADYFPILKWIDPQGNRHRMEGYLGKLDVIFHEIIKQRLENRRRTLECSSGSGDFLDKMLDYKKENGLGFSDLDIICMLKDIFTAGVETTAGICEWAMTELFRNPKTTMKAKLELKEKLRKYKLIDESDTVDLPYLHAIVKETFRLHPPVPLLLPHKAESSVEIGDFIVPKNAKILINVWSIGRDPNVWENPTSFSPERFLHSNMDFKGRDFELVPFGAGRRICPGIPLALRMISLILPSLVHLFDWILEEGLKPEDIDMEDKFGLTLQKTNPLMAIHNKRECIFNFTISVCVCYTSTFLCMHMFNYFK